MTQFVTRGDALAAVRTIIQYIGDNPDREGLVDTPERVVRSWERLYGGYTQDAKAILERSFQSDGYDQMIMLGPVEFYSTCEHHLLPFVGTAHVAYIPGESKRVVGVSKLARVVEVFARRLQIQERLTAQIADAVDEAVEPLGVGVIIRAKHLCMTSRGVEKPTSSMTTAAVRGALLDDARARTEFYDLVGHQL